MDVDNYCCSKLADWESSDEEEATADKQRKAALARVKIVILKHMFGLKDLEEDPRLLLDLKEDVREECETLGEVTNVVLYDVSTEYGTQNLNRIFLKRSS